MPSGCDSTFVLHLTINQSYTTDLNIESCEEYTWYGTTYTESGIYEHLLQSSAGCDSLLVLHLTIGEAFMTEEYMTACNSLTWHENIFTESGDYTVFVINPEGCDSTFILHLTMGYDVVTDTTAYANGSFTWYGETYTESGEYEHHLQTTLGCDSLVILKLFLCTTTVHPVEEVTTCNLSYEWHGHTYTENGVYYDTITGEAGCDDIYTLKLALGENIVVNLVETVCDQYPWQWAPGGYLTESGEYTQVLQTEEGCDSIVNLSLVVNHTPELIVHGPTLVAAATNLISGICYYYVTDSLSIEPNTLEWVCSNPDWVVTPLGNGYRCRLWVTTTGEGALKALTHSSTGCDVSFGLEILATFYGVDDNVTMNVEMYPNPTRNMVTIEAQDITRIRLIDVLGQVLMDQSYHKDDTAMFGTRELAEGLYMVEITTEMGKTMRRLVVVK
jgi:hypothetical protein